MEAQTQPSIILPPPALANGPYSIRGPSIEKDSQGVVDMQQSMLGPGVQTSLLQAQGEPLQPLEYFRPSPFPGSDIFTKEGRETVVEMLREHVHPDDVPSFQSFIFAGGITLRGMRYIHQASLYADIPLYTFLLLHGASLERATEGGVTPLLLLCYLLRPPPEMPQTTMQVLAQPGPTRGIFVHHQVHASVPVTRRLEALQFLLSVGADHSVHGPQDIFEGGTPLHMATAAGCMEACELLLKYGADVEAVDGLGRTPESLLPPDQVPLFTQLAGRYRGAERPPQLCFCGEGKLYSQCHAGPEDWAGPGPCTGVLIGPEDVCPCASSRKYRRCCMRYGVEWRLCGGQYLRTIPATTLAGPEEEAVCSDEEEDEDDTSSLSPSTPGVISEDEEGSRVHLSSRLRQPSRDGFDQLVILRKRAMAGPLLQQGRMDPAFHWVLLHRKVTWMPRGLDRQCLDEKVKRARMIVWNAAVDQYIANHCPGPDPPEKRIPLQIAQEAKIGLDQGPLHKRCWRCGNIEDEPGQFRVCQGCSMASYCSDQCQSIAWEEQGHQEECEQGQTTIKGKLPSQAALDEALAAMGPIMNLPLAQQLQALQQQVMDMSVAAAAAAAATPPKASRASSKGSRASAGSTPKSKASGRGIGFAGVGDDGDADASVSGGSAMRRSEGSTGAGSSRTDDDVDSLANNLVEGEGDHDDDEEEEPWGEEVLERGRATPAAALLRDRRGRNAAAPARPHAGSAAGGPEQQEEEEAQEAVPSPMTSRRKRQTGMPRFVLNDDGSLESEAEESERSESDTSEEEDDDDGEGGHDRRVLVPLVEHVPNVLQLGSGSVRGGN